MLIQSIQGWHERVCLFASFSLTDLVRQTIVAIPHVPGVFVVEEPDKREQ